MYYWCSSYFRAPFQKKYRLNYIEISVFLLFYMGVKLGLSVKEGHGFRVLRTGGLKRANAGEMIIL
jgi:hypothetical protein